jgi:hypothetical protein
MKRNKIKEYQYKNINEKQDKNKRAIREKESSEQMTV